MLGRCQYLNTGNMSIPDWFNRDYIEEALRVHHKNCSLVLYDCDIKTALAKGENYGGVLIKVTASYELKITGEKYTKYLIGKTCFEDDAFALEKMQPYDIFNREMSIYEQVLPELQKLLFELNDDEQLFAKAVYVDYRRQALLFEDLSVQGYVMADRTEGLDNAHIELILRKLAKMHATSAVFNERNQRNLEKYDRGFFNLHTNSYSTFFLGNLTACAHMLTQWPEYVYYSKKLMDLHAHYMNIGIDCFLPSPNHVNVLCHGDLWTNNVMFKYDKATGKPLDVIIIDFQYSAWGSPALDLHYFFNTSLREDIRLTQLEGLFQLYFNTFRDVLSKLKYKTCPIPTLHRFLLDAERKRFMAFHSSCIIQPVMINDDMEDADFNTLMSENERGRKFKQKIYKNLKVQTNVKNLLPLFERRGLLEFNQCT